MDVEPERTLGASERIDARWFRSSAALLDRDCPERLELSSTLSSRQAIHFTSGLLQLDNPTLACAIGERDSLVVTTPTVQRLYGEQLSAYLHRYRNDRPQRRVVLAVDEASKTLEAAQTIIEHAAAMALGRRSPIVAIGGGVCLDVCGFAASVYRRGVASIKVPTTLLGLVDAGIGTKNGLNLGRRKSALGSFHPPEHTLIDADFLPTLDARALRCGLAECLKMAIVCQPDLFDLIERHGPALIASGYACPAEAGQEIIQLSASGMLEQLSENLFEHGTSERLVDFGHTFSPVIESASDYSVHHGEAVAIDMAISVLLARDLGWLAERDARRILATVRALGLPVCPVGVGAQDIWNSLASIIAHRNGRLSMPVPTGIGRCRFVADAECLGGVEHLQAILSELRRLP